MNMHKWMIFSAAAALAMAGCSTAAAASATADASSSAAADVSGSNTITGKVTAIDGNSVTISVGTLNTPDSGQMPSGDGSSSSQPDSGSAPSGMGRGGKGGGMKEDSTSGATPSSSSDSTTGATPSQSQGSDAESGADSTTGATPSQSQGSDAESGSDSTSGATMGRPDGGRGFSMFEDSGETKTIDISGAEITGTDSTDSMSASDIAVDDIIVITLGTDGKAVSVEVQDLPQMGQKQMIPDGGDTQNAEPQESADSSSQEA